MKRILLFALLLFAPLFFWAQKVDLFVLCIGVEKYKNPTFNLQYPEEDAKAIAEAFQKQEGGLFNKVYVKTLLNEEATSEEVLKAISATTFPVRITEDDMFVLMYSGHGTIHKNKYDGHNRFCLVPYNYDRSIPDITLISKEDLDSRLDNLGCNYAVLLDACHSGAAAKSKDITLSEQELLTARKELAEAMMGVDKNVVVIGSSASDQSSFECDSCGHGYFTQALLDAFNNKTYFDTEKQRNYVPDKDKNGAISVDELDNYLKNVVGIMTRNANPQRIFSKRTTSADFPFLVLDKAMMAIFQGEKPLDSDNDGFADADDKCPSEKGTALGCPDSDKDGVPDKEDYCKDEKGTFANKGCPSNEEGKNLTATMNDVHANNMVLIEGGTFTMGGKQKTALDQYPAHQVTLNSFYLSKYEVTFGEFKAFIDATGYKTSAEKGKPLAIANAHFTSRITMAPSMATNWRYNPVGIERTQKSFRQPIYNISWNDAMAYIAWLNKETGGNYRLPTEAEWEYAATCRGKDYMLPFGNDMPPHYSYNLADSSLFAAYPAFKEEHNYADKYVFAAPVEESGKSELGLYGMAGNVSEFCSDWYDENYYKNSPSNNPQGASTGSDKVLRGGSWLSMFAHYATSFRDFLMPDITTPFAGFRLAKSK